MRILDIKQGEDWAEVTVESTSWVDGRATYVHRIERTPRPYEVNGWPVASWRCMTMLVPSRLTSGSMYARGYYASREEAVMSLLSGLGMFGE